MLNDYSDKEVCEILEFGFPLGIDNMQGDFSDAIFEKNHKGAVDFPDDMFKYFKKEIQKGAVLGPFHDNPFSHKIIISLLNSVAKKMHPKDVLSWI